VDLQSTATFAIAPPWRHRYAPDVTHNLEHHFAVLLDRRVEPTLQPEEHVRGRWVTWSQAFAKVTSWTNRVALLALRRRLDG
jgi:dATP pyrophosphohydrolase